MSDERKFPRINIYRRGDNLGQNREARLGLGLSFGALDQFKLCRLELQADIDSGLVTRPGEYIVSRVYHDGSMATRVFDVELVPPAPPTPTLRIV